MPKCTVGELEFGRLGRQLIEANFEGGAISSDDGLMLIREVDRRLGLSKAVAVVPHDPQDQETITHSLRDWVAQRLYERICDYEDLNDHDRLRNAPLMQMAVGKVTELGSTSSALRKCPAGKDRQTLGSRT
jgi:hypothetical protein